MSCISSVEKRHFPEGLANCTRNSKEPTFAELSDTHDTHSSMNSRVVQLSESPVLLLSLRQLKENKCLLPMEALRSSPEDGAVDFTWNLLPRGCNNY